MGYRAVLTDEGIREEELNNPYNRGQDDSIAVGQMASALEIMFVNALNSGNQEVSSYATAIKSEIDKQGGVYEVLRKGSDETAQALLNTVAEAVKIDPDLKADYQDVVVPVAKNWGKTDDVLKKEIGEELYQDSTNITEERSFRSDEFVVDEMTGQGFYKTKSPEGDMVLVPEEAYPEYVDQVARQTFTSNDGVEVLNLDELETK